MSRATILAVMHVRPGVTRRILLSLLVLVIVTASACSAVGPPKAASVGDAEISADKLNDLIRDAVAEQQAAQAAQTGTLIEDTALATIPSGGTAILLTALIYEELVGDEVDPSGAMAETIVTDPVRYNDNVALALGGAEAIEDLEVACALVVTTETLEQMTEVLGNMADQSLDGLQALGAQPLCMVRDDPRFPPELVDQFWDGEIGTLQEPLPFDAFEGVGFDGAPSPLPPGVILTGVLARGPIVSPDVGQAGQAVGDLFEAWGRPAVAAGQAVILERSTEAGVTVDPRYGIWNGVQVVDPGTLRFEEEQFQAELDGEPAVP